VNLLLVFATLKEAESFFGTSLAAKQGEVFTFQQKHLTVEVLVTGITILNSALFLSKLLSKKTYDLILNLGIAGVFASSGYNLGETVLCKREVWPELGVEVKGKVKRSLLKFPLWAEENIEQEIFLEVDKGLKVLGKDLAYPQVSSLTVSTVTGSRERAGFLAQEYGVEIENMEGFALAYTALIYGIPFLEVRTLSNIVGSREKKDWDLKGAFRSLHQLYKEIFEEWKN